MMIFSGSVILYWTNCMHVILAMSTETCALAVDGPTKRASAKIPNAVLFMGASALCLRPHDAYPRDCSRLQDCRQVSLVPATPAASLCCSLSGALHPLSAPWQYRRPPLSS